MVAPIRTILFIALVAISATAVPINPVIEGATYAAIAAAEGPQELSEALLLKSSASTSPEETILVGVARKTTYRAVQQLRTVMSIGELIRVEPPKFEVHIRALRSDLKLCVTDQSASALAILLVTGGAERARMRSHRLFQHGLRLDACTRWTVLWIGGAAAD
ncbi:hypothetical protein BV22DRAFT_1051945 [Leucogyrophana mollusca]|uniref:Uncharacterized protein n=1 Tax=Leucogyrophana mollusca TaxID=85980 RepID=A0ACB8B0A2_9AGAM|nr:hypothetical protein BV22DRAFT_1051945 [Leucogyrophana mollusca]